MMCTHENEVEDEREGDVVCTDCGLVLSPIYHHQYKKYDHYNYLYNDNKHKKIVSTSLKTPRLFNILQDETIELGVLCNKLQIYSATRDKIFEKWEKIKKWYSERKFKDRKNSNFKKGLIVMAIYQTLIDLDIPRPMSHLCQDAGIGKRFVWHWMELYHKNGERKLLILQTSSMSEYFLKPLDLCYQEIREIKQMIDDNDILTYAPKTLLASCAYVFLRNKDKKKFSVEEIAELLGVSVMSIYRCLIDLEKNAQREKT